MKSTTQFIKSATIALGTIGLMSISSVVKAEQNPFESKGYIKASADIRHNDYGLDLSIDGTNYLIDENVSTGYTLSAGFHVTNNWDVEFSYTKHDKDNADGIIAFGGNRFQAPIFYQYERVAVSAIYHHMLTDDLRADFKLSYQSVEQGAGDFFIQINDLSFGLNSGFKDKGWVPEISLVKTLDDWEISTIVGYDPDANLRVSSDSITLKDQYYYGVGAEYKFNEKWSVASRLNIAKTSDFNLSIKYQF